MPVYRHCSRCRGDILQATRVCAACVAKDPNGEQKLAKLREYWTRRRADPVFDEKQRAQMRARWDKIPKDERRQRSREAMARWRVHPENRAKMAARERALGKEVLDHYGKVCCCCGEDRYEFLSIDHPNNDGADHRRIIGPNLRRWLKRNGFPSGYRTMCMNCNFARGRFGYCPHEKEVSP